MTWVFHNLESYLFERFEVAKIEKDFKQIDTTNLPPMRVQELNHQVWRKIQDARPKTAECWSCDDELDVWLFKNVPDLDVACSDEGLSGHEKALIVQSLIKLACKHEINDLDRAAKLASLASFLHRHPVVFSYE